jgi:Ferric uptake regulator family
MKSLALERRSLLNLNGEKHFYEAKTNIDHLHLACFQCGRIEEYTSPLFERLKAEISRHKSFHVRVIRLEVGGRCSRCCASSSSCADCTEEVCCKLQARTIKSLTKRLSRAADFWRSAPRGPAESTGIDRLATFRTARTRDRLKSTNSGGLQLNLAKIRHT